MKGDANSSVSKFEGTVFKKFLFVYYFNFSLIVEKKKMPHLIFQLTPSALSLTFSR